MARELLAITTSWDDGHPADLRVAELLDRHRIQGTFYVPSHNSEGRPVMQPNEIAWLAQRFEIGGHTQSHVSLTQLPPHVAAEQIEANKNCLEDLLGREIQGFAYVRGHHNRRVRAAVARAGYRYARTVKNLSSNPGADRYAVPTTVQFYSHPHGVYVRNYVSGGPTVARSAVLAALLRDGDFIERISACAQVCSRVGGWFHLWGHSWEIEEQGLWESLSRLLGRLRELNARHLDNAGWCDHLLRPPI